MSRTLMELSVPEPPRAANIPGAILNFYVLEIGGVEFERSGVSPGSA